MATVECLDLDARVAALADTPAGPDLARLLAGLDPASLSGFDCVEVLRARYRQANHERGELFAVVSEVLQRSDDGHGRLDPPWPDEFGTDEVRAALVLTRRAAEDLCALAADLLQRLPGVQAALRAGLIDQPRARVFSGWTQQMTDPHAAAVVAALLPKAPNMTTGELAAAIRRQAIALDPQWARRRYEKALRGRRVEGTIGDDGTGTLSGHDLPADQVATACARLDALAKAAKQAGHPAPIDHLRADLFLGMTDGSFTGLDDTQILHRLLADLDRDGAFAPNPDGEAGTHREPGTGADDAPAASADHDGSDDEARSAGPGHPAGPDQGCAQGPAHVTDPGGEVKAAPGVGGAGLRLMIGLRCLAGVDSRPGELLGWGPVHAELARTMAADATRWWYVLTDPDGTPLEVGPIRRRPDRSTPPTSGRGGRGLQVWLHLTQASLAGLHADPPPGWSGVLAEISRRATAQPGGPPNTNPHDRLPTAALRRWLHIRDRSCTFPGCRVPAHRCDSDHSVEYAKHGRTSDDNLAAACRHDHRLRHHGGWSVTHTKPGRLTWTSRLAHTYHRNPPPAPDDLPDPMPNPTQPTNCEDQVWHNPHWRHSTCLHTLPSPPTPPPPPPPPPEPTTTSPPDNDIPPY